MKTLLCFVCLFAAAFAACPIVGNQVFNSQPSSDTMLGSCDTVIGDVTYTGVSFLSPYLMLPPTLLNITGQLTFTALNAQIINFDALQFVGGLSLGVSTISGFNYSAQGLQRVEGSFLVQVTTGLNYMNFTLPSLTYVGLDMNFTLNGFFANTLRAPSLLFVGRHIVTYFRYSYFTSLVTVGGGIYANFRNFNVSLDSLTSIGGDLQLGVLPTQLISPVAYAPVLQTISGNLTIAGPGQSTFFMAYSFPALQTVTGSVTITNQYRGSVTFGALNVIGGGITLKNTLSTTSSFNVSFPFLNQVSGQFSLACSGGVLAMGVFAPTLQSTGGFNDGLCALNERSSFASLANITGDVLINLKTNTLPCTVFPAIQNVLGTMTIGTVGIPWPYCAFPSLQRSNGLVLQEVQVFSAPGLVSALYINMTNVILSTAGPVVANIRVLSGRPALVLPNTQYIASDVPLCVFANITALALLQVNGSIAASAACPIFAPALQIVRGDITMDYGACTSGCLPFNVFGHLALQSANNVYYKCGSEPRSFGAYTFSSLTSVGTFQLVQCDTASTFVVSMPQLVSTQSISINGGTACINFPSLTNINTLYLTGGIHGLATFNAPSLVNVGSIIFNKTMYSSLVLPPSVRTMNSLIILDGQITFINASSLVNASGDVIIGDSTQGVSSLATLALDNLYSARSFATASSPLTQLSLVSLFNISTTISVQNMPNLCKFFMCALRYVGRNVSFALCPHLSTYDTGQVFQQTLGHPIMTTGLDDNKRGVFSCNRGLSFYALCNNNIACIQEAVDRSFRDNGDTVYLPTGTYTGCTAQPLNLTNRILSIASQFPNAPAVIDCQWTGRFLTLDSSSDVTLIGIVIQNSGLNVSDTTADRSMRGGAVYVAAKSSLGSKFVNCRFTGCTANVGGAVYAESNSVSFVGCSFIGNAAVADLSELGGTGGAVAVMSNSGTIFMVNAWFEGNHADNDGGAVLVSSIRLTDSAQLDLTNATLCGNLAGARGGAIYTNLATSISGGVLRNNSVLSGGGLGVGGAVTAVGTKGTASTIYFSDMTLVGNNADGSGGGMAIAYFSTVFTRVTFMNNRAGATGGGLLHAAPDTPGVVSTTASQLTAIGNVARLSGGALALNEVTATISGTLMDNTASGGDGGALWLTDCHTTVSTSTLTGNQAMGVGRGGAVFSSVVSRSASLSVSGSSFSGNAAASNGGALFTDPSAVVFGSSVSITGNNALGAGGGVFLQLNGTSAPTSLASVSVSGNLASAYGPDKASDVNMIVWTQLPPTSVVSGATPFSIAVKLTDAFGTTLGPGPNTAPTTQVSIIEPSATLDGLSTAPVDATGASMFSSLYIIANTNADLGTPFHVKVALTGAREYASAPVLVTTCPPGQASILAAQILCADCPIGTFSNGTRCETCPYGTTSFGGAAECPPCKPGYFNDASYGTTTCIACSEGYFSTSRTVCEPCPAGSFWHNDTTIEPTGIISCEVCPLGKANGATAQANCTACVGSYAFAQNSTACTPCPANAVCNGATVTPNRGYQFWSPSQASGSTNPYPTDFQIIPCLVPEYCTGSPYPGCTEESHRTEYACGACMDSYYMIDQRCTKCPDVSVLVIVVTLFINALFAIYAVYFQTNMSARIKILVFFGQTMSLILKGVDFLPQQATVLWSVFNLGAEWIPGTCLAPLRFYERLAIPLFTPFLPLIWIGVLYLFEKFLLDYHSDKRTRPCCFKFIDTLLDTTPREHRYIKALIFILLFCYTPIMSATFSVLNCVETFPGSGDFRLAADTSYSCLSSEYKLFKGISLIVLLVFVVPFPIVLFFATVGLKAKRDLRNLVIRARYGVVYLQYIPELFWWESIMQARKIVVAAIVVLAGSQLASRLLQVFFFSLLLFVQLSLVPFRARSDNRMETAFIVCMLTIAIVLSSGWSIAADATVDRNTTVVPSTQALLTAVVLPLLMALYWHGPMLAKMCGKTRCGQCCVRVKQGACCSKLITIFTPVFQDAWNEGGSVYGGDDDRASVDGDDDKRRSRASSSLGAYDGIELDHSNMGSPMSNPVFGNTSATGSMPVSSPLGPAPPPRTSNPPLPTAPPPVPPSGPPYLPPPPPPVMSDKELRSE